MTTLDVDLVVTQLRRIAFARLIRALFGTKRKRRAVDRTWLLDRDAHTLADMGIARHEDRTLALPCLHTASFHVAEFEVVHSRSGRPL